MEKKEFKIKITTFMPYRGMIDIGTYKNGEIAYLGDQVLYRGSKYHLGCRHGKIVLLNEGNIVEFNTLDSSELEEIEITAGANIDLIVDYTDSEIYYCLLELGVYNTVVDLLC